MSNLSGYLSGEILDPSGVAGLIGEISQLDENDPQYIGAVTKIAAAVQTKAVPENTGSNSRTKMLNRMDKMPPAIAQALLTGKSQIIDHTIYAVKAIGGRGDIEMLQAADDKQRGVTNINKKQLEKDQVFLLEAIRINYALSTAVDGTDTQNIGGKVLDFEDSSLPACIKNGEINMKVDKTIFLEGIPVSVMDNTGDTKKLKNTIAFANPKIIKDQVDIDFEIKFADQSAPAKSFARIEFIGSLVVKA